MVTGNFEHFYVIMSDITMAKKVLPSSQCCFWLLCVLLTVHTATCTMCQPVRIELGETAIETDSGQWKFPITCVLLGNDTSGLTPQLRTPSQRDRMQHTSSSGSNFTFLLDLQSAQPGLYWCALPASSARVCVNREYFSMLDRADMVSALCAAFVQAKMWQNTQLQQMATEQLKNQTYILNTEMARMEYETANVLTQLEMEKAKVLGMERERDQAVQQVQTEKAKVQEMERERDQAVHQVQTEKAKVQEIERDRDQAVQQVQTEKANVQEMERERDQVIQQVQTEKAKVQEMDREKVQVLKQFQAELNKTKLLESSLAEALNRERTHEAKIRELTRKVHMLCKEDAKKTDPHTQRNRDPPSRDPPGLFNKWQGHKHSIGGETADMN